jgi:hypothetical protein
MWIGLLAFADAMKCTEVDTVVPAAGEEIVTDPEAFEPTEIIFVDLYVVPFASHACTVRLWVPAAMFREVSRDVARTE